MTNNQYGNFQTPSSRPPEPPYRADVTEGIPAQGAVPPEQGGTARMPYVQAGAGADRDRGFAASASSGQSANARETAERYAHVTGTQNRTAAAPAAAKPAGAGKTFLFGFLGALLACGVAFGGFALWNGANGGQAAGQAAASIGTTDSSVINAVEEGQTLAEAVAAKALPSVVAVYNYQQSASTGYGYGYGTSNSGSLSAAGMGSGVLISEDGYILTNYHVIDDADKLTVKVGDEERDATLVGGDESSDVAVVKVDNIEGLTVADIGDSNDLAIGEWVMTVGAPLGLEQSVATGVVSATNRSTIMSDSSSNGYSLYSNATPEYTYYPNMIQTDAVINPGNSGGALVDADGKLIGINTMISSYSGDYAGVGFAIPINYAIGIAEDVIAGKEPTHALLGVSISQVNASVAQRYGLSTDKGAYIGSIAEGSGAADAGLEVGDIITAINGKAISSATDVTLDVREHQPGDTVTVTVNRNGESLDFDVVLSSDEETRSSTSTQTEPESTQNGNGGTQGGSGSGSNSHGYTEEQLEELLRMLGW